MGALASRGVAGREVFVYFVRCAPRNVDIGPFIRYRCTSIRTGERLSHPASRIPLPPLLQRVWKT